MTVETPTQPDTKVQPADSTKIERRKLLGPPFIDPGVWSEWTSGPSSSCLLGDFEFRKMTGGMKVSLEAISDPPGSTGWLRDTFCAGISRDLELQDGLFTYTVTLDMGLRHMIPNPCHQLEACRVILSLDGDHFWDQDSRDIPNRSHPDAPDISLSVGGVLPAGSYSLSLYFYLLLKLTKGERPFPSVLIIVNKIPGLHQHLVGTAKRTSDTVSPRDMERKVEVISHPMAAGLAKIRDGKVGERPE